MPIAAPPEKKASQEISEDVLSIDSLKEALYFEIEQQRVQVIEGPTLRIVNIFHSGSDQVKDEFIPMLGKIAKILNSYNVRVLVVGHTDNQPIFSGRFPSNWHLSEARAKSVAIHLAVTEEMSERIRYEGHGANEPVASNDTEKNRALNRRIDIHIR
jgi:type VI secretion system protein ImpK